MRHFKQEKSHYPLIYKHTHTQHTHTHTHTHICLCACPDAGFFDSQLCSSLSDSMFSNIKLVGFKATTMRVLTLRKLVVSIH